MTTVSRHQLPVGVSPARSRSLLPSRLRNPRGRPRFLVAITWLYIAWALAPVVLAMLFSFNGGRSRSVWQGFSLKWWVGNAADSVFQNPAYTHALLHSFELALLDMAIATPLGVLFAIGLSRWRGRGSGVANAIMLVPLVTPELVLAVALLVIFTQSIVPYSLLHLGTPAQVAGQVTFSLSYVVVIIRSRLASIGPEYEEAARDLGATRFGAMRLVLLPLLGPAILASYFIVFALSIDDFVVTQYTSSTGSSTTIPMLLYASARGSSTTPALNALGSILVGATLLGVGAAYAMYRLLKHNAPAASGSALQDLSILEVS